MTVRRRICRPVVATLVFALALGGCDGYGDGDGDGDRPAFSRGDADTAIEVTLQDFAFVGLPVSVAGPRLFVTATNAGPSQHEFEILEPPGMGSSETE